MKKYFLRLLVLVLLSLATFYLFKSYAFTVKDKHCLATQISARIFDFNTFTMQVETPLKLSDFKVINVNGGSPVFLDGQAQKGIKNEYGY